MKRLTTLCLLCAALAFITGCAEDEADLTGALCGIVTDADSGEPINSANVSINPGGKTMQTGTDGRYEFTDLVPGQYTVQAAKNDYQTNTKHISVVAGETAKGDVSLQKATSKLKLTNNTLNFGKNWSALSFGVGNAGITGRIDWRISAGNVDWIQVSPLSGTTETGKTTEVIVTVLRDKVSGPANGIITISDDGGSLPVYVTVNQDVQADEGANRITVEPENVAMASAYRKDITICSYNSSANFELFVKEENVSWLTFSKTMGILPVYNADKPTTAVTVGFMADRSGLPAGDYTCTAVLRTGMGDLEIPVSMKVNADGSVDKTFEDFCLENYDTDKDGVISDEEAAGVTEIDCSNQGLVSLAGIERFTNLWTLKCENNRLTNIDVSKNTELRTLWCHNNQLTSIDVSQNVHIDYLRVENNQLTSLDVSKNSGLRILYCENNQLTSLDVTQCLEMYWFECYNNSLTSLDLSKNTKLSILTCGNNQLTSLDLSKNTLLQSLDCRESPLSVLDVSQTALTGLICADCQLTVLDVSMHKNLQSLYCDGNPLTTIYMAENYESVCTTLSKPFEATIVVKTSEVTGKTFEEYALANFDMNSDGVISDSEASMITSLDCSGQNLTSMVGIEKFVNLKSLNCSKNKLTELNISQNTKLTDLDCTQNQLTSLDVSKNTVLGTLRCDKNFLTALDVSKNVVLEELSCRENSITVLDVSLNTILNTLNCGMNQLTALDVSKNTALRSLSCYNNQLTALDVSKNTALRYLGCLGNLLASLDVSKNVALEELHCSNNQLVSLNVSGLGALWQLLCNTNKLTALNLSQCTSLKDFMCSDNDLAVLDVSSNIALEHLSCQDNRLTTLDISNNKKLLELYCNPNESLTTIYAFSDYDVTCRTIEKPETTQIIVRE